MIRRMAALALLAFLVTAAGCGKKTVPVEGTIKLGGKALADANITLTPIEGSKGVPPASGKSDSNGSFKLSSGKSGGVAVGDYVVSVSKAGASLGSMKPGDPEYMKKMAEMSKGGTPTETPEQKAISDYNRANNKVTVAAGTAVNIDIPGPK